MQVCIAYSAVQVVSSIVHKVMTKTKNGEPRLRKRPKQCAKGCYHLGAALLFSGLIVAVLGVASTNLFEILVYDNRHPPLFHHITIHVGLFAITSEIQEHTSEQRILEYTPVLDEPRWTAAKVAAVVGIVGGIFALLLHLVILLCTCSRHRAGGESKPWCLLLVEVLGFLTAVIGLLIGLSLAECEIESVHNAGDEALTVMLQKNDMLASSAMLDRSLLASYDIATGDTSLVEPEKNPVAAEFGLVLSPPGSSFYMLIAADFILLLAFLAALVYFVRVSKDVDNLRKQLRSANVTKPTMT